MCASMADIQSAMAEIRRGTKEERRTNDRMKYIWPALLHRAAINEQRPAGKSSENDFPIGYKTTLCLHANISQVAHVDSG